MGQGTRSRQGSIQQWMLPLLTLVVLVSALAALALFHPSLNNTSTSQSANSLDASPNPALADVPENAVLALSGATMGTRYRVLLAGSSLTTTNRELLGAAIGDRLETLDREIFSTYVEQSQLSRLNSSAPGQPMTVSAELMTVLAMAKTIHGQSTGAFDVTVKPLVDLWGFGAVGTRQDLPPQSEIDQLLARTGMHKLILDTGNGSVTRTAGLSVDLSAIAKGYAVDDIARLLDNRQVADYLVEIGGEVRVSGTRPTGESWQIGIETPATGAPGLFQTINTGSSPVAIAASGNYRNYFMVDGERYAHTLDPRTGWPVSHDLASVTVIADSAMVADAWATALTILGHEAGMKLANELQLAAYFIVNSASGYSALHSEAFNRYL